MNSRRVILIAYYFPPAPGVGGDRPYRFYKYLKELGYPCTVITASAQPSLEAPADVVWLPDPLASVWDGDSRQRLSFHGHLERFVRRFLVPGATGVIWSLEVVRLCDQILRQTGKSRAVLLTSFPPLGVLLAGLMIALRERITWIADFRDPLTAGVTFPFYPRFTRFLLVCLERLVFRAAGAVIANVEGVAALWRDRHDSARSRIHVIWNGFDPEARLRPEPCPPAAQRTLLHAGELYDGRNPNVILESLARLRQRGEPEALNVRILLVGPLGNAPQVNWALLDEATRQGWLEFRKPIPREEARRLTARSEGLLLLQPRSTVQVPAKLFEYLCVGRPILALVPPASAVEYILGQAGVPYVCIHPEDDPDRTDRAFLEFLRFSPEPVAFGPWFAAKFDGRKQTAHLATIIERIAKR